MSVVIGGRGKVRDVVANRVDIAANSVEVVADQSAGLGQVILNVMALIVQFPPYPPHDLALGCLEFFPEFAV